VETSRSRQTIGPCSIHPANRSLASTKSSAARRTADGIGQFYSCQTAALEAVEPDLQRRGVRRGKPARRAYRKRCAIDVPLTKRGENMMTRYGRSLFWPIWRIALVALIAAMPRAASSQEPPKQFEDIIESLRRRQENEEPVATFGDWRIVHLKANDAFNLIGTGTLNIPPLSGDDLLYFSMVCFRNSDTVRILIPIFEASPAIQNTAFARVSYWNDLGTQGEVLFTNWKNNSLLVETGSDEEIIAQVKKFVAAMTEAKKFFAWSYEGKTLRFSADDISVALTKWKSMCPSLTI
jgi:hypothetical protein